MTQEIGEQQDARTRKRLRLGALALAVLLTLLWIYSFYCIAARANPKGDGMEFLAVVPLTILFLGFTLPALVLSAIGRASGAALGLAIAGLITNAWIWSQIVAELGGNAVR